MLADLSSAEYSDWRAFAALEPVGVERGDVQAAVVASTVANVNRDPQKPGYDLATFMPFTESRPPDLSERVKQVFAELGHGQ